MIIETPPFKFSNDKPNRVTKNFMKYLFTVKISDFSLTEASRVTLK